MKKNINNSTYNIQNNIIFHNLETSKKATSPLTSRNPNINQLGINLEKTKNVKTNKKNTYFFPEGASRNRYTNNMNFHNKAKSTIRGSIYNNSINKIVESQNSKSKEKKILNKTNTKYSEVITKNKIGYKEISTIKNKNSRNRNDIKHKILNSGFNNNSRNINLNLKNKNKSQTKTIINKKKNNLTD